MAGVVDAADSGKLVPMPLDLVYAGRAQIHPVESGERDVESPESKIFMGVMWVTTRIVWPRWSRRSRSQGCGPRVAGVVTMSISAD